MVKSVKCPALPPCPGCKVDHRPLSPRVKLNRRTIAAVEDQLNVLKETHWSPEDENEAVRNIAEVMRQHRRLQNALRLLEVWEVL